MNLGIATLWCAMRKGSETKDEEKTERKGEAVASARYEGYHGVPAQARVLSQPIGKTSDSTGCTSTRCGARGTCEEGGHRGL